MKSPKDMKVIQIEITNSCGNRCANCSRFCGHQKKPFFMDYDTFQKATDSMAGFSGVVGIMGGEPTLHPDFERFVHYFKDHFGYDEKSNHIFKGPVSDFIKYICTNKFNIDVNNKRGLWSSMGPKYYKYFELIQDTFGYQCLNDHTSSSMHETLMVTRKELGIPDEEWYPLRDSCWVQNLWSASITPKGAFFCEVAAALDMLFDGPGGWPIEPGWWKRTPLEFGDQLHWCEFCSAPLAMPKRDANKELDDASPLWCSMLEKIQSPKYLLGKVQSFDVSSYDKADYSFINDSVPNLKDQSKRLEKRTGGLTPNDISIWLDMRDTSQKKVFELIKNTLLYTSVDGIIATNDLLSQDLMALNIPIIIIENNQNTTVLSIASTLNAQDFILILKNYFINGDPRKIIEDYVFNPGIFYYYSSNNTLDCIFFNARASSLSINSGLDTIQDNYPHHKRVRFSCVPDHPPQFMKSYNSVYRREIDALLHPFRKITILSQNYNYFEKLMNYVSLQNFRLKK